MRLAKFTLFLACVLWPVVGGAQDAAQIERIADTMVRLCLGGGRSEVVSGGGSGGADLSLRSLDVKGTLTGEFKVNKSSAEGLVEGINNAISQVAADQADKVRACLQPVRDRLLDVMLPPKGLNSKEELLDIAGKWQTQVLINPNDESEQSILVLEFMQQGDTLQGTVTEMDADRRHSFAKSIIDGKIHGNIVSFYTQGEITWSENTRPYKEFYSGSVNNNKSEIAFKRQTDVPSGGVPETFAAKRIGGNP